MAPADAPQAVVTKEKQILASRGIVQGTKYATFRRRKKICFHRVCGTICRDLPLRVRATWETRGRANMRQLPEDRIKSALALGSDAHRFVAEIDALVTRARRLIKFRPRAKKLRKSSPRKSC